MTHSESFIESLSMQLLEIPYIQTQVASLLANQKQTEVVPFLQKFLVQNLESNLDHPGIECFFTGIIRLHSHGITRMFQHFFGPLTAKKILHYPHLQKPLLSDALLKIWCFSDLSLLIQYKNLSTQLSDYCRLIFKDPIINQIAKDELLAKSPHQNPDLFIQTFIDQTQSLIECISLEQFFSGLSQFYISSEQWLHGTSLIQGGQPVHPQALIDSLIDQSLRYFPNHHFSQWESHLNNTKS